MKTASSTLFLVSLAVAVWASALIPGAAEACGGFFCQPQAPVIQNAERIIFTDRGDGRITTIVQVQYSGPAERFSWVIPVPGIPDVGVSSNIVFQQLDARTRPVFQLQVEDDCNGVMESEVDLSGSVDAGSRAAEPAEPPGVSVLASGSVGPFDYEVIRPNPELEDAAEVAVAWLQNNGYEVGAIGPDLLRPYLDMGQNLIAFRLQKTADTGDIRPVTLTYQAERALIPIQLTAVAAQPDMGVLVWVFGPHRAVPVNYLVLEPNLALVDWFRGGRNWPMVVTAAGDEAGGQGFVTEMAQALPTVDPYLPRGLDAEWSRVQASDWSGRELTLLNSVNGLFRNWDGLLTAYEKFVPVPSGVELRDFLNCPSCFGFEGEALPGMDIAGFLNEVETMVAAPVRATDEALEDAKYLTRLFTTLSPEEMTKDPAFDFNPDLTEVDRVRQATARRRTCDGPVFVSFPDGRMVVANDFFDWPSRPGGNLPANNRVLRAGLEGPDVVVVDNGPAIDAVLRPAEESSSCRTTGEPTIVPLAALALILGGLGLRRRREQR